MPKKLVLLTLFLTIEFLSFGSVDSLSTHQPYIQIDNYIPNSKNSNLVSNVIEKLYPLFGVLLGFILGMAKEYFSKRSIIEENGHGWTECFIQIEDPLIKQIKEIEHFIEKNPEDVYEISDFSFFEALEGTSFEEYDQRYLTSFLMKKYQMKRKDAIKLSGKLKSIIRILKSNHQNLTSFFTLLTENTSPHFQEFGTSFAAYRKVISEYIDEIISSDSSPEQRRIAEKIMNLSDIEIKPSIRENIPLNLFRVSNNFIRPFFEIAFDDRNHPKLKKAIDLLSQCDHSIMAIKLERRYFLVKLEKVKKSLEKNLIQISELIEKL